MLPRPPQRSYFRCFHVMSNGSLDIEIDIEWFDGKMETCFPITKWCYSSKLISQSMLYMFKVENFLDIRVASQKGDTPTLKMISRLKGYCRGLFFHEWVDISNKYVDFVYIIQIKIYGSSYPFHEF